MKTNYVVSLLCGMLLYVCCAQAKVITSPYTPSIFTRHAKTWGVVAALSSKVIAHSIIKSHGTAGNPLLLGVTSCVLGYLSYLALRPRGLDALLLDSKQALQRLCKSKSKKIMGFDANNQADQLFAKKYVALTPEARTTFENHVDDMFARQLLLTRQKTLQYVGFGSESLLKDLIILTRVLSKHPTAQIDIHLIGSSEERTEELAGALEQKFSAANLQLYSYDNIDIYVTSLSKKKSLMAHVCIGIDITGELIKKNIDSSRYDIISLVPLIENKSIQNRLLTEKNGGTLRSISLTYSDQAQKKEAPQSHGGSLPYYVNTHPLQPNFSLKYVRDGLTDFLYGALAFQGVLG